MSNLNQNLGKKNLCIVRMVPYAPDADSTYLELYEKYWTAVDKQLSLVESKVGAIKFIFVEGVVGKGEDVKVSLQKADPGASRVVNLRIDSGASCSMYEDESLLLQVLDLGRCAGVGLMSNEVITLVRERYLDVANKRMEFQKNALVEGVDSLAPSLLLTRGTLPPTKDDVERIIVSPPEMDALERWSKKQAALLDAKQNETQTEDQTGETKGASKLWTPNA